MNNRPLVSIIIPTRNRKTLLSDALASALNQTYPNLQVIVHDNNSTDGTGEMINAFFSNKKFEYYRVDHDLSMTENWNTAYRYAKGDYFMRLDDDNIIDPNLISSAVQEIKRRDLIVMSYSPIIVHLANKLYLTFSENPETVILSKYQALFFEYFTLTDSNLSLYKTSALKTAFPDGNIYQTTLPDRNLNYRLIDLSQENNWKIGFNSTIMGLTRYDYRSPWAKDYSLSYSNYKQFFREGKKQSGDCHDNFSFHRATVIRDFLHNLQDQDLKQYFESQITNPILFETISQIGALSLAESLYTFAEIKQFHRIANRILLNLVKNYQYRMENRNFGINLVAAMRLFFIIYIRSIQNMAKGSKRSDFKADESFGRQAVKRFTTDKDKLINEAAVIKGDLFQFLNSIPKPNN